jgi:hypothetical protein
MCPARGRRDGALRRPKRQKFAAAGPKMKSASVPSVSRTRPRKEVLDARW